MNNSGKNIWLELASNDLKCAEILYSKRQYRNSYFLFQQSTEKANKALGLITNLLQEKDLNDVKHNQFKMYRQYTEKQIKKLNEKIKQEGFTSKSAKKLHAFTQSRTVIDSLYNSDLITISGRDINNLLGALDEFKISRAYNIEINKRTKKLNQEVANAIDSMMDWKKDLWFISSRLTVCAILTIQHSSKTRYPISGFNPLQIYTSKLPLVKKQIVFMKILRQTISRLKKFEHKKIFGDYF